MKLFLEFHTRRFLAVYSIDSVVCEEIFKKFFKNYVKYE